ncbi:MAG: hypothetical protein AAFV29_26020, partial [Myxococcota bacterium]
LSAFTAAAVVARGGEAVIVADDVDPETLGAATLRAAETPVVADLRGIFAWARNDHRVFVDGATGQVRLNPTPGEIARFRRRP